MSVGWKCYDSNWGVLNEKCKERYLVQSFAGGLCLQDGADLLFDFTQREIQLVGQWKTWV